MSDPVIYFIKKMLRYLFWISIAVLTLAMLLFSDHYILGTTLNITRTPLLLMLAYVIWISYKKGNTSLKNLSLVLFAILMIQGVNKYAGYEQPFNLIGHSSHLKVLSFNLNFKNKKPKTNIKIIVDNRSDILVLQEFTPKWEKLLDQQLGNKYRYKIKNPSEGADGLAVYSIHPIKLIETINGESNQSIAQIIELTNASYHTLLVNAHLASTTIAIESPNELLPLLSQNYNQRKSQWDLLSTEIDKHFDKYEKCILSGDLNTSSWEPLYFNLRENFVDCYSTSGNSWGKNFPNIAKILWPLLRLDYIFTRGNIEHVNYKVLPKASSSSDHLAIQATFKL